MELFKSKPGWSVLVAVLLAVGLSLLVAGCMGGGQDTVTTLGAGTTQATIGPISSQTTAPVVGLDAEALSTFESKDPFIQQAVPPTTTTTGSPGSTTTTYYGTTTTYYGTTTTYYGTTTTYYGTTTTAHPTTTTTTPHTHSLKILSVGDVGGAPAVTLQVDNSIYKDKRVGDVMSTSWGQIKVLSLSTASKVATLLQGSETLTLAAGQQIYE
jgi:hypothetical protein